MKIEELIERNLPGSYLGLKPDMSSLKKIEMCLDINEVINPLALHKMHTTVIFSKKHLPRLVANGPMKEPIIAIPNSVDIFTTNKGIDSLVLLLDSPELVEYHNKLMDEHKATYSYPTYIPHLTLSYNIEDKDYMDLDYSMIDQIVFNFEYTMELDLNWIDKA